MITPREEFIDEALKLIYKDLQPNFDEHPILNVCPLCKMEMPKKVNYCGFCGYKFI
ncbi:MAG: hypothetical protein QXT67_08920 [Candidatus Bathyarchaeia archaeon]